MDAKVKIKKISLLKTSILLSVTMLGLKMVTFFRDMMIARHFGATIESDAFLVSGTIIGLITSLIISPLAASFIPIASELYMDKDKERFNKFIGSSYFTACFAGIVITIFQFAFLDQIIKVVAPGFSEEGVKLIYTLVIIQLLVITTSVPQGVNIGILQLLNKFSIAQVLNNLGIIASIVYLVLFRDRTTIQGITIAFTLGNVFSAFGGFYIIFREGIFPKLGFKIVNFELKKILQMMILFAIASGVREINIIVDKAIGSLLPIGSITMMSYASKLTVTQVGLISVAISTVAYSQIAKLNALSDENEMKQTFVNAINMVNTLIFPMVILTIVLRFEIVNILFGRGEFTEDNVQQTAQIMMSYAIGMIGFGMQDVLTRTFHAFKIAKYTVGSSILLVLINVVLSITLYKSFGANGVAFSSSISVLSVIGPLFYVCNRYVISLKGQRLIQETIKIFFNAIICGIFAYILKSVLLNDVNIIIKLIITVAISMTSYFLIGYIIKINVIRESISSIKKKITK